MFLLLFVLLQLLAFCQSSSFYPVVRLYDRKGEEAEYELFQNFSCNISFYQDFVSVDCKKKKNNGRLEYKWSMSPPPLGFNASKASLVFKEVLEPHSQQKRRYSTDIVPFWKEFSPVCLSNNSVKNPLLIVPQQQALQETCKDEDYEQEWIKFAIGYFGAGAITGVLAVALGIYILILYKSKQNNSIPSRTFSNYKKKSCDGSSEMNVSKMATLEIVEKLLQGFFGDNPFDTSIFSMYSTSLPVTKLFSYTNGKSITEVDAYSQQKELQSIMYEVQKHKDSSWIATTLLQEAASSKTTLNIDFLDTRFTLELLPDLK